MMPDLSRLPRSFADVQSLMNLSTQVIDRVLDPEIFIEREGERAIARLVGVCSIKGQELILRAPTIEHTWVTDGKKIFPVPTDSPSRFTETLGKCDASCLTYKQVLSLLGRKYGLSIRIAKEVLETGKAAAERYRENIEVPGLNAQPFPYQAKGIQWIDHFLRINGGVLLADEMGLGKTLQVIGALLLAPPSHESPALVLCPSSLIENWCREIRKFAPSLTVQVHRGYKRTGVFRGLQQSDIVITTYDTLINDSSIINSIDWSWLICDEAQALKNPDSSRRQVVTSVSAQRRVLMTGTPVENSLLDLWSLVDIALPGLLGSRTDFESTYDDSHLAARALGEITDPVMLRRRVPEVAADLPEKILIDIPLYLEGKLARAYLSVREETLLKYPEAGPLVATMQLQLFCAHPWLRLNNANDIGDVEVARVIPDEAFPLLTPKLEHLVLLLKEAFHTKTKVLVFSLFNRIADLIQLAAGDLPQGYWATINGSTPQDIRQSIIDDFSDFDGPGCLILNPKAAGAGLNITAATLVIHYTPVWNPALESQASARAHRRGQKQPVTVVRLFYEDTVERVMVDRSLWKEQLGNEVVPLASRDSADLHRALLLEPEVE